MTSDFPAATVAYNAWLSNYLTLDGRGLEKKRSKMDKKKVFPFLRGSFYRWAWQFSSAAGEIRQAPSVLSVGDTHLENFGTWRDDEGRLVWGVNDFDEAAELPFTSDLVRLASSLLIARRDDEQAARAGADDVAATVLVGADEGVAAILDGYRTGLARGCPFILDEPEHETIRGVALAHHDPTGEWDEIRKHEATPPPEDLEVLHLLLTSLPQGARPEMFQQPLKGLGALGRPRWTVIANWNGGLVAREAKAAAPSAAAMPARPARRTGDHRRIAAEARRAPDPAFLITERWVVRRLSPEARKIELGNFLPRSEKAGLRARGGPLDGKPARPDSVSGQLALLQAMGAEVANVHAGTAHDPDALLAWLAGTADGWLLKAAELASEQVANDHAAFRSNPGVVLLPSEA